MGESGWRELTLWVLPENRAALAFYGRFDFVVEEGVEKREERSGRPVIRLRAAMVDDHGPDSWTIRTGTESDVQPALALWELAGGPASTTDTESALEGF